MKSGNKSKKETALVQPGLRSLNISSTPWHVNYNFGSVPIFPLKCVFEDLFLDSPSSLLCLSGWQISSELFEALRTSHKNIAKVLMFDNLVGLNSESFEFMRGFSKVKQLNLEASLAIDISAAKVICSFSLLVELDLSECRVEVRAMEIMSLTCSKLRTLKCCHSSGLDDFCIVHIASWIQRFRTIN